MADQPKKPSRGKQNRPTRSEINDAWQRVRTAAARGDVQASALLIALSEGRSFAGGLL